MVHVPVVFAGSTINLAGFCISTGTFEPLQRVSAIKTTRGQLQSLILISTLAFSGIHGAVAVVVYSYTMVSGAAMPVTSTIGRVPPGVGPDILAQLPCEGSTRLLRSVFRSTDVGPDPIFWLHRVMSLPVTEDAPKTGMLMSKNLGQVPGLGGLYVYLRVYVPS